MGRAYQKLTKIKVTRRRTNSNAKKVRRRKRK